MTVDAFATWRWMRLGDGVALHLCPPTLLERSHAACGRPIREASAPVSIHANTPRCLRCLRAARAEGRR